MFVHWFVQTLPGWDYFRSGTKVWSCNTHTMGYGYAQDVGRRIKLWRRYVNISIGNMIWDGVIVFTVGGGGMFMQKLCYLLVIYSLANMRVHKAVCTSMLCT